MPAEMQECLDEHHRQIRASMAEIRRHYEMPSPDVAGLGTARLTLSRVSAARTRYVREEVLPALRRSADAALIAELDAAQRAFAAKRLASSEHITTWSTKAVVADWNGYRDASRRILSMMEEQIERERHLVALRPEVRAVALPGGGPPFDVTERGAYRPGPF